MNSTHWALRLAAFALFASCAAAQTAFSPDAKSLPFPPDAREVEFGATFGTIEYKSGSSVGALANFYRTELPKRGWTEDESAAESDDDGAEMTFTHDDASVEIELYQGSDEVDVSIDTEELDFAGTNDPAAMLAAGVPQPRAYLFLQKELPRPEKIVDEEYSDDAVHFKSPLELPAAFDFYMKALTSAGWRETRRPIIEVDRRYTEFQKGPIEVSVNIFTHEVGSRIILDYENATKEAVVPPLVDVALAGSTPGGATHGARATSSGGGGAKPQAAGLTGIDVTQNRGSATVTLGAKTYQFNYAAAYRTKEDGEDKTTILFCDRAIPYPRLQAVVAKEDDVDLDALYPTSWPGHISIDVGEYSSFNFNSGGTGIGDGLDKADVDVKSEGGRLRGTIKLHEPKEFFDEKYMLTATIDAAVVTPTTVLGALPPQSIAARPSAFPESEQLLPEGAGNVQSVGSRYTMSTQAEVDLPLADVAAFYRNELVAKGWNEQPPESGAAGPGQSGFTTILRFKKPTGAMTIKLTSEDNLTKLDIASSDDAKAKQDGMLPELGKSRIVLANAHPQNVVIMIGKQSYPLRAGQGTANPREALNYSVAPGKYELTITVPGKSPQHETLIVPVGQSWGVIVFPTGETLTNRLY